MNLIYNLNRRFLTLLTLLIALFTFIGGLYSVLLFQSKYLISNRIERVVLDAEKLSSFDKSITLERALKIYGGNLSFAFFNRKCDPVHITDMMIFQSHCKARDNSLNWLETTTLSGEKYIIGFPGHFDFRQYFEDYRPVLFSTMFLYVILILALIFIFFHLFIDTPIGKISHTINQLLHQKKFDPDSFTVKTNTIFHPLYNALARLTQEVGSFYQQEQKILISRQIAHDLRAPLSILQERLKDSSQNQTEKMAIRRIIQISDELMPPVEKKETTPFSVDDIFRELSVANHPLKLINDCSIKIPPLELKLSEIEIFRFISNIIKNAKEAHATEVKYNIKWDELFLSIDISDNGDGVATELIPEILNGKTTKDDGHGLGLSSISKRLIEIGGGVEITSAQGQGFSILIKIPGTPMKPRSYVLIDDDRLIRIGWMMKANEMGLSLHCFENIEQFMEQSNSISTDTYIYIDSQLKNGIKGEEASEKIASLGFSNIYLATGYSSLDFDIKKYPWIRGIISKTAPF